MSAPGSHIVGKLVKRALELRKHSYRSGPWEVVTDLHEMGGTFEHLVAHMRLLHYGTDMLAWTYKPSTGTVVLTGKWIGHGSVSDQTGVNSALMALKIPLRYSRDIRGGGPRINRRRRYA